MTGRERIVVRAGAALVAVGVTARVILALVQWSGAIGDRVRLAREVVARQEALIETLPELERRADSLKTRVLALADRLVPGRTEPEAQAELLARVESAIVHSGATVELSDAVPDSVGFGRLRRVTARAVWQSDLRGVLRLMRQLEFGPTLLTVEQVRLSLSQVVVPGQAEQIRADMVVEGWYLAGEA